MKKIQILKAAVVVLAIGGALASKAQKMVSTYFTQVDPTQGCTLGSPTITCGSGSNVCSQVLSGGATRTYYQNSSCPSGTYLMKN
jgi:hypothetical protein